MAAPEEEKPWHEGLDDRERRFVEEYCIDTNKTQAAIRAGYAGNEDSAAVTGHRLLRKAKIFVAKERYLNELALSASEALKQTSDIARTRLNDFIRVERVLHIPKVRKSLDEMIHQLQYENRLDVEFISRAGLPKKEEDEVYAEIQKRNLQILRYQIELEENPNAFRDVNGEGVWIEEARPDLVALAKAKETGRIKSISFTKFGPKLELYPADAALARVLEAHGKLKPPGSSEVTVVITPEDVESFKAFFDKKY